ncbi:hypothetical protein Tco_0028937, partial [Tanacetum coccineum]
MDQPKMNKRYAYLKLLTYSECTFKPEEMLQIEVKEAPSKKPAAIAETNT